MLLARQSIFLLTILLILYYFHETQVVRLQRMDVGTTLVDTSCCLPLRIALLCNCVCVCNCAAGIWTSAGLESVLGHIC